VSGGTVALLVAAFVVTVLAVTLVFRDWP